MAQTNDINVKGQWQAITYGFKVGAPQAIDDRLVLTKEQMRNISDDRMPDRYFAICNDYGAQEDGKLFLYKKSNPISAETGRFELFEDGKVKDVQLNGASVVDANKVAKLNITAPFKIVNNELCCVYDDSL